MRSSSAPPPPLWAQLKERRGAIDRVQPDGTTAIVRALFKKETDMGAFVNLKVVCCPSYVPVLV